MSDEKKENVEKNEDLDEESVDEESEAEADEEEADEEASEDSEGDESEDEDATEEDADEEDEADSEDADEADAEDADEEDEADAEDADEEDEADAEDADEEDESDEREDTAEEASEEEVEDDDDAEETEKDAVRATERPSKLVAPTSEEAVTDIFQPHGPESDVDLSDTDDVYLSEDDLGEFHRDGVSPAVPIALIVVVVLGGALGYLAVKDSETGKDLKALAKGELKERKIAEAKRAEEEFREKQLAELELFGTLSVTGKPTYAKIRLDGEQKFSQPKGRDYWVPVRLKNVGTQFFNLRVKESHVVEVSNPGFETKKLEISRGWWQQPQTTEGDYTLMLNFALVPMSPWHKYEFEARMSKNAEHEFYGGLEIDTVPDGATINLDGHEVLSEEGQPLRTPAVFEKYWIRKPIEDDDGKPTGETELVEKQIRVDTQFDAGHKLVLSKQGKPKYAIQINRPNWKCERMTEDEFDEVDVEEPTIQHKCNYKYKLDFSFNQLERFIQDRKKEMKRIEEKNKELKADDDSKESDGEEQAKKDG